MNILAFSNRTGSKHWRLQAVANYINNNTEHAMYVSDEWDEFWGDDLKPDIVVGQMWRNPKGVDYVHSRNIPFVYEADDSVVGVADGREKLMKLTEKQEKQSIDTYKKADAITVTTPYLAEHYKKYNHNVKILPNYLDFMWWGQPWKAQNRGQIRVGWMGSTSHHEDLIWIAPIIKELVKQHNIKFVYCGYGGKRGIYGKELFGDIPANNREYVGGVPLEYWPQKSKSLGLDIGIAPLIDDEFNSHKSPIKYFEYSANGVPGVYADNVVYRDTVKHGTTGFLAKTQDEWIKYLSELITNTELRAKMTINAYADVLDNYSLSDHYKKWLDVYQEVINERASRSTSTT